MGELPRNVREFVVRDLIYIAGGGMVLVSFLYRFDRLPDKDTPLAFYLLGAGIAYVIGNALQDIFSIFGVVTTAPVFKLGKRWSWIYRRFTNDDWKDISNFDPVRTQRAIRSLRRKDRGFAAEYERVISGLILAATMTPCTLASGLLVLWRWLVSRNQFDLSLGTVSLVLSSGLFVLARVRAAQMARIDADAPEEDRVTSELSGPENNAQGSMGSE
jgi:hypothetical protein